MVSGSSGIFCRKASLGFNAFFSTPYGAIHHLTEILARACCSGNMLAAIGGRMNGRMNERISGTWDACIIGGGPAGLAAAIALRLRGLQVVVADGLRPPIDKACGEGLMPDSISAMQRLGIEIPAELGRRFFGIRFIDNERQIDGDFSTGYALAVRRTVLHEKMVERAEACGVNFRWGASISHLNSDGVVTAAETIRARWIVGADGARSLVRRWAGPMTSWAN